MFNKDLIFIHIHKSLWLNIRNINKFALMDITNSDFFTCYFIREIQKALAKKKKITNYIVFTYLKEAYEFI